MKALIIFLLGAAAGAYGFYYLQTQSGDQPASSKNHSAAQAESAEKNPTLGDRIHDNAMAAKDAAAAKLAEWHLTPEDIRSDLERTGQVVRTKAQAAGASIADAASNARIITTIKAKYSLDNELSARAIAVDCDSGQVTLRGNVASPALIAKAISLALETDGVVKVNSLLTVTAEKK